MTNPEEEFSITFTPIKISAIEFVGSFNDLDESPGCERLLMVDQLNDVVQYLLINFQRHVFFEA